MVVDDPKPSADSASTQADSAQPANSSPASLNAPVSLGGSGVPEAMYNTGYGPTLREIVAERLASMYSVQVDELRVEYDTTPAVKYLDLPIGEVADVAVLPQASTGTTRIPLRVELRRRDGVIDYRTLAAKVELKRTVAVVSAPIDRGELITEDLVRVETRWISPAADAPLARDRVIGASAKRRIETGRLVTRGDVQPPVVVQRGDTVKVRILSGTIQIELRAKALSSARDGESVTLQSEGSKKTFVARMEGRQAIADIGSSSSADRPEPSLAAK
jgi:flagella basal body P-ring formation protein FlgA